MGEILKSCFKRNMLTQFFLGIYGGLPLLLIGSTLQAWMREEGVDLKTIGIFAFVGLPYTLKFLWAPLMDRYTPPFLDRRRGWMICTQVLLVASMLLLSLFDPKLNTALVATICFFLAFFSASQDIVIDAYRRETLTDEELGLGSSLYVNGYRIALLISGAFALFLADKYSWKVVYQVMALIMSSGVLFSIIAPRVITDAAPPKSMNEAIVLPFKEYFSRDDALLMLAFILFYKVGDSMAAHMAMPLYLDLGYTKTEIAAVAKGIGMIATISGGLIGGVLMIKTGINRALWVFGGLQMISTIGFSFLAMVPKSLYSLTGIIGFENLCSGMGTTAFVAFMASITNQRFTATQYALLTSLMGIPRVIASAPTGKMVEVMGYPSFFIFCTLIAIPGLFLLSKFAPLREKN